MISVAGHFANTDRPRLLCLGAHSDDLEIGAGATILQIAEANPSGEIAWIVFSGVGERRDEAQRSAEHFAAGYAGKRIEVHGFEDGFFPYHGPEIKRIFETLKRDLHPDIVFTHFRDDRHQDHRLISDLTWQTFRDHLILEYEIPKYDGDLATPNLYVPVSEQTREEKLKSLDLHFGSQRSKDWFTRETFLALMRLRGVECRSGSGYAEAFHCRKLLFTF